MQFKKRKTGKDLLTSNEYFQASLSLSLSLSRSLLSLLLLTRRVGSLDIRICAFETLVMCRSRIRTCIAFSISRDRKKEKAQRVSGLIRERSRCTSRICIFSRINELPGLFLKIERRTLRTRPVVVSFHFGRV